MPNSYYVPNGLVFITQWGSDNVLLIGENGNESQFYAVLAIFGQLFPGIVAHCIT